MNVLGISLGHDSSVAIIEDGVVHAIMEAERFFRQKRFKLHCLTLEPGRHLSGFQYVNLEDFSRFLEFITLSWGTHFDAIAVQNQGRVGEFTNVLTLLRRHGIRFSRSYHVDHHLSHAALAYYSSPYRDAVVLSYDGMGNDGHTVIFHAVNGTLTYLERSPRRFGQSYNNIGYMLNIRPDVAGSTAGKTMGLAAYGQLRSEWLPAAFKYVRDYVKRLPRPVEGLSDHGKAHQINPVGLEDIPDLRPFLIQTEPDTDRPLSGRLRDCFGPRRHELLLPGPEHELSQDLAHTVQHAWTEEVLSLLSKHSGVSRNLCVVGGCALNGITNYRIKEAGMFDHCQFVPNPTDCGLSAGAALYAYIQTSGAHFEGSDAYFSPYLGVEAYDLAELPELKLSLPHRELSLDEVPPIIARLVFDNRIVGVIRGRYEVGPRALGNRSIFCNPLNSEMQRLLNEKVKRREWFRPFAPAVTAEDASEYFTTVVDIPYMSVICYTRLKYRDRLPSVTHADGSARVQTVRHEQNPWLHRTLKEFQRLSGMPILLNTSFNPGGEPILNFCRVGLEMLTSTDLDVVLVGNTLFCKPGHEVLLEV